RTIGGFDHLATDPHVPALVTQLVGKVTKWLPQGSNELLFQFPRIDRVNVHLNINGLNLAAAYRAELVTIRPILDGVHVAGSVGAPALLDTSRCFVDFALHVWATVGKPLNPHLEPRSLGMTPRLVLSVLE